MTAFGLMTYSTKNLGDDIQSLAAKQFLPRVDHYVDRDHMSRSNELGDTHIICNGWFMEPPYDWPPPSNIHPLFTSFHITENRNAQKHLANPSLKNYYKNYEPIGCRDTRTAQLLKDIGVETKLTYCLSLALKRPNVQRTEDVFIVDPYGPRRDWRLLIPHALRNQATCLTHDTEETDWEVRFRRAEKLLQMYARAKCVITGRLHCALPCLAFGTPVLFIKRMNDPRIRDYLPMLHSCSMRELFLNMMPFDWQNPPPNPVDVTPIRDNLLEEVSQCLPLVHFLP